MRLKLRFKSSRACHGSAIRHRKVIVNSTFTAEAVEKVGVEARRIKVAMADMLGLRKEMVPKIEIRVITGVPRLSHPPPKALPVIDVEKMDNL